MKTSHKITISGILFVILVAIAARCTVATYAQNAPYVSRAEVIHAQYDDRRLVAIVTLAIGDRELLTSVIDTNEDLEFVNVETLAACDFYPDLPCIRPSFDELVTLAELEHDLIDSMNDTEWTENGDILTVRSLRDQIMLNNEYVHLNISADPAQWFNTTRMDSLQSIGINLFDRQGEFGVVAFLRMDHGSTSFYPDETMDMCEYSDIECDRDRWSYAQEFSYNVATQCAIDVLNYDMPSNHCYTLYPESWESYTVDQWTATIAAYGNAITEDQYNNAGMVHLPFVTR